MGVLKCWKAFCGILVVYLAGGARGQQFENVSLTYKPMTDDWDVRLRGSFDIGRCAKRLLNCWEVIKPEIVCSASYYKEYFDTVCTLMRNFGCNDVVTFGFEYPPYSDFEMFLEVCRTARENSPTRRLLPSTQLLLPVIFKYI